MNNDTDFIKNIIQLTLIFSKIVNVLFSKICESTLSWFCSQYILKIRRDVSCENTFVCAFFYALTEESKSVRSFHDDDDDDAVVCSEKRKVERSTYTLVTSSATDHSDQVYILRNARRNCSELSDLDLAMTQWFELRLFMHTNHEICNGTDLRDVDKKC